MELTELQQLLADIGTRMQRAMSLGLWDIQFVAAKSSDADDGRIGLCSPLVSYETAVVTLYSDRVHTRVDVLRSVRHELIHIMLSDVDMIVECARTAIGDNTEIFEIARRHAEERQVLATERLLDSVSLTAEKLLEMGQ